MPAAGFEDAVDEALRCGARAIVAITAGFAETGEAGAPASVPSPNACAPPVPC
ncbi:hypothetical protein O1M54_49000 [Streptomyces diastatochromogenes]|nr:hypothetical protein [Streptomyces diastatochromogenes]